MSKKRGGSDQTIAYVRDILAKWDANQNTEAFDEIFVGLVHCENNRCFTTVMETMLSIAAATTEPIAAVVEEKAKALRGFPSVKQKTLDHAKATLASRKKKLQSLRMDLTDMMGTYFEEARRLRDQKTLVAALEMSREGSDPEREILQNMILEKYKVRVSSFVFTSSLMLLCRQRWRHSWPASPRALFPWALIHPS